MKLAAFLAGFFRTHAPESSTRLVGIVGFFVGFALSAALIVESCRSEVPGAQVTWTDITVLIVVFSYAAVALKLRSPFPPEMLAILSKGQITVETEKKTETTQTTEKTEVTG